MKKTLSLLLVSLMVIGLFSFFNFNVKSQVVGYGSIDSGLVGYWRLNEGSGIVSIDSSGVTNSLTLVNSPLWTSGKYINGLQFNASLSQKLTFASSTVLKPITSNYTWNFFINYTSGLAFRVFDCLGSLGYLVMITTDGHAKFIYSNSTGSLFGTQSTGLISNGTWCMVTVTLDQTNNLISYYLNGVFDSSIVYVPTSLSIANPVVVGYSSYYASYSSGQIDELRVYNRVLLSSEISILHNGEIITVTHDSGSTITPNGTVLVGVDQNQTFIVGANSGYVNWVNYFDNVPLAPSSLYLLSGVQSSHSLFITSQFIGDNPTNTPILVTGLPINSFTDSIGNFPYLAQLLLVSGIIIMLMLSMLYLKKRGKL